MSRLDELIKNLCPNGVEFKSLSEIATITRGGNLQKKDFVESGIPCIHYGQIYTKFDLFAEETLTFIGEDKAKKQKMAQPGDIVMAVTSENIEDICKCVVWFGNEEVAVSGHTAIIHHNQNAKYLAYYFHSSMFYTQKRKLAHGTKVMEVTPDHLANIRIPVPPLEVQREIVRILDHFKVLTAELTTEITAELSAREKQYEYYKKEIMNSVEAEEYTLGEVCEFVRGPFGGSLKKSCFKPKGYAVYEQQHAIYSSLDFRYFIDDEKYNELRRFAVNPGELIVSCSGTIGQVFIIPQGAPAGIINQALLKLAPREGLDARYLKYFFETTITSELNNVSRGGAIKNVPSVAELKKLKIRIPDNDEQIRLINKLDAYCELSEGICTCLPAEIEARQKQYEYYRDKLLTFKELS